MGQEVPATRQEKAATANETAAQHAASHEGLEMIVADPWVCSVALGILLHDMWSAVVGKVRARREIARLERWYALPS